MQKVNCWFVFARKKAKVKLLVCVYADMAKTIMLVCEELRQSYETGFAGLYVTETAGLYMHGKKQR